MTRPLWLASLLALACGAPSPPASTRPAQAAVQADNHDLVRERYCAPLAELLVPTVSACGCSAEPFLSRDELVASCEYHLVEALPEDRPLVIDEPALARCLDRLRTRIDGCGASRLPRECELHRIADVSESVALERSRGEPCRRTNGDEGFDAHFVCAEGLACIEGVCADGEPPRAACAHPLAIPIAAP
jgi:hypothetical protein